MAFLQVITTSVYQALGPAFCYVQAACGRRNAGLPSMAPTTLASSSTTGNTSSTVPGSVSTTSGISSTGVPYSMEQRSFPAPPAPQDQPSPAWAALCGLHGRLRLAVLLAVSRGSDLVLEKPPSTEELGGHASSDSSSEGGIAVLEPVVGEDGQYVVDVYCERLPVWYRRTTYERVAQVREEGQGCMGKYAKLCGSWVHPLLAGCRALCCTCLTRLSHGIERGNDAYAGGCLEKHCPGTQVAPFVLHELR
jgi:hypothetical protein